MDKNKYIAKEKMSDEEFKLIADYIAVRHKENISQRDLAEKVGMAQSTIGRLETNLHSASLTTFLKLLNALGYHLEIKKNRKKKK